MESLFYFVLFYKSSSIIVGCPYSFSAEALCSTQSPWWCLIWYLASTLTLTHISIIPLIFLLTIKPCHLASINLTFHHLPFNKITSSFKIVPSLQRLAITDIYNAGAPLINTFLAKWIVFRVAIRVKELCAIFTLSAHDCEHFAFSPIVCQQSLHFSLFGEGKPSLVHWHHLPRSLSNYLILCHGEYSPVEKLSLI